MSVVGTTSIPGVTHPSSAFGPQNFDAMPDGTILMRLIVDDANASLENQITIVLNWFEELQSRAPR